VRQRHDPQVGKNIMDIVGYTSQNHRMAWVGRDLRDHESPTPLPGRATNHPIY